MEGTSHPAPPTGGFRMTGNSEQYAFKKVNIEEYVKVIYKFQPAASWWRYVHNWTLAFRCLSKPVVLLSNIWNLVQIEHCMFKLV